ncbi:hypothetical protein GZL_01133 [Streptomyces sp. 769]|nr:hypothetical protein GZL_01133 [Streptomyces sp. 769]
MERRVRLPPLVLLLPTELPAGSRGDRSPSDSAVVYRIPAAPLLHGDFIGCS